MATKKTASNVKKTGTDVATRQQGNNNIAKPSYMKDGNRGSENVTASDVVIPRIGLVQALSPQRKKTHAAYIAGAEEGVMFNSVTNELYDKELTFIPVYFKVEYVIWRDREKGGGFRGAYDSMETAQRAMDSLEDAADCEIIETAQHYVLIRHSENELEEAILSMSVSKMTASRKLNSLIRIAGGDRFSRHYLLSSTVAEGKKGEYQNYTVKMLDGFVTEDEYRAGETMYENIVGGKRVIERDADIT